MTIDWTYLAPDGTFSRWAEIFASAIEVAHSESPQAWNLSYNPDGEDRLALNIGQLRALRLVAGKLLAEVFFDPEKLSEPERERLNRVAISIKPYQSKSEILLLEAPQADVLLHWDVLKPAFLEATRKTVRAQPRTKHAQHHSAEAVRSLAEAVGRDLPEPDYSELDSRGAKKAGPEFSERTFELLRFLHEKPIKETWNAHKPELKQHVQAPLQALLVGSQQHVPPAIAETLEKRKGLFARILKNDHGQGGAWDYYWGAMFPKGRKRTNSPQLYAWVNRNQVETGFMMADKSEGKRERLLRNLVTHRELAQDHFRSGLGSKLAFGWEVGRRDESGNSPPTFENWLESPHPNVCRIYSKEEVIGRTMEDLAEEAGAVYAHLFPMVLLATLDDPADAIRQYLDGKMTPDVLTAQAAAESATDEPRRYWKISAGRGGVEWNDFRQGGYAAVGWAELGDLANVTREEFEDLTEAGVKEHGWSRNALEQTWKFSNIRPGDVIVANAGTRKVLGIGTVTDEYHFVEDQAPCHRIPVSWQQNTERTVNQGGWRRTLIRLSKEDFDALMNQGDEDVAETDSSDAVSFADILSGLASKGLFFPDELVANFLLSLQAKRFVILTGISGTGKTKLALEVARHFAPDGVMEPAAVPSADGALVTVKPYMQKYSRLVVPSEVATLALASKRENKQRWLRVELPDGQQHDYSAYTKGGSNLLIVLFSGEGRPWVQGLELGTPLHIDWIEDSTGDSGLLRIGEAEQRIVAPPPHYRIVAVRPDWIDSTGLLGYFNPLTSEYTATPFLQLLIDAKAEQDAAVSQGRVAQPFFAILDEMNLARVEHYFSDFLSALESEEPLELHQSQSVEEGETGAGLAVPRKLKVPPNVFFVGTVNVDETTFMFSPKVLDRAFTIEFNDVLLGPYGQSLDEDAEDDGDDGSSGPLDLELMQGLRFRGNADSGHWSDFCELDGGSFRDALIRLNDLLALENRHFGYRVANEIARYVLLAQQETGNAPGAVEAAFDLAVLQKVLPKLHGTQQELDDLLEELFGFAAGEVSARLDDWTVDEGVLAITGASPDPPTSVPWLPRTAFKLWRMRRRLRQQGFTSFIE